MKVLHVIPSVSLQRGGPSQAVLKLVKSLRECGVDAEIATTNDNGSDSSQVLDVPLNQRIEYEKVPVWFFPQSAPATKKLTVTQDKGFIFSADLTWWLGQNLRQYDLLNTHYLFSYASTCAGAIARWQKVPYVVRTIGQLAPWALAQSRVKKQVYSFLVERRNLNRAAAIHCTSVGEAEDARNFGVRAPTITLPLGVDRPPLFPQARQKLRHIYGISPETPVVLFLSRLHYKKRPDLLVQALSQLGANQQDFHLMLAGAGEAEYLAYLNNLVSSLGLAARTSFPGFVTGQDKDLLLQGSDIFVLPSFSENFGIAVAEAMAAGLPVVITPDIQISPEIAADNAGLVVPGEVEPLAAAIAQLLASPEQRRLLGENGKSLVSRHYSWDATASHLTEVYRSIIDRKPLPTHLTFS